MEAAFGSLGGLGAAHGQSFGHHCFELLGLDVMLEDPGMDAEGRSGGEEAGATGMGDEGAAPAAGGLKPLRCLLIEVN